MHDRAKGPESTSELRENVNAATASTAPSSPLRKPSNWANSADQQRSAIEVDKPSTHSAAPQKLTLARPKSTSLPADVLSTASNQPVLVRAYSAAATHSTAMRRSRPKLSLEPVPNLPPLSSFSFQDILKEIDPEIQPSIDAIAEIFGRSKLSLADEYSSHLPPQGELSFPASHSQSEVLEAIPNTRLEPVEESTRGDARRQSLALVGTGAAQPKSGAVAATSTASVASTPGNAPQQAENEPETKALLFAVLTWLRNSNVRSEMRSRRSSVDPRAAESLQKILGES